MAKKVALPPEVPLGNGVQRVVDEPHEAIARLRLASVPFAEELGYLGHGVIVGDFVPARTRRKAEC